MSCLEHVLERRPFEAEWGRTGARFEKGRLADGTPVVIKHVSPDDWVVRASGGVSFIFNLWEAGAFDRVPAVIDHTMLAAEPEGEGWVVVMRDASDAVLAEGRVLSRDESRRVLAAAHALHREFWDEDPPAMPVRRRFEVMTPKEAARHGTDQSVTPLIVRGWELFPDVAPPDVCDAVSRLLDDPTPLTVELEARPSTLIHGDLRLHNIGLTSDRVVMLDWEIAGIAPPAVEIGWYLIISATRIDATREQILDDYREVAGDRFDPYALELGLIGALMWLGWNKALDILEHPDPAIRAQERADLDWWISRVRRAFEVWSPVG